MALLKALRTECADLPDQARKVTVWGVPMPWARGSRQEKWMSWTLDEATFQSSEQVPHQLSVKDETAKKIGFAKDQFAVWLYQSRAYLAADSQLSPLDVRALLNVEANKRRLALEKAHALQAMSEKLDRPRQRERVPQEVRIEVWQRDGGRCVECASQENLEFDHIIPFGLGGSSTARNLQLLCGDCNRRKGMTLG